MTTSAQAPANKPPMDFHSMQLEADLAKVAQTGGAGTRAIGLLLIHRPARGAGPCITQGDFDPDHRTATVATECRRKTPERHRDGRRPGIISMPSAAI